MPRRVLPGSVAAAAETMPRLEVQLGLDAGVRSTTPTWSTVTELCRQVDWELAGRQHELGTTETGKAGLTLRNDAGAFDPTSNPTIKPYRHLRIRARLAGQDYHLWRGFMERPSQRWAGRVVGWADIIGVDLLAVLAGGRALSSAYAHEVLADNPVGYYPLGEPSGSATAGNLAATQQPPGTVRASGSGAGTNPGFGADAIAAAEPSTAFTAGGSANGLQGTLVELGNDKVGGPFLSNSGGWSYELWFRVTGRPDTFLTSHLLVQTNSADQVDFRAGINDAGKLIFNPADSPTTTAAYDDGLPHHLVFVMDANSLTYHVYVDGTQVLTATNAGAGTFSSPRRGAVQAGGNLFVTNADPNGFAIGAVGHVALYQSALSATRVTAHYQAGKTAFTGESSGARVTRLLRYARHVGEVDIDTGSSTLSGATTIPGQNPAQALQDVATWEAGAVIAAGDGKLTFHARTRRYNQTAVCTFGDAGGSEIGYTDLTPELSPDRIVNRAEFDRVAGGSYATEDTGSIDDYGLRVLRRPYGVASDLEVIDAARYTVDRNAQPTTRVESIQVNLHGQPTAVQATLLGLKFGDRVTVKRRPTGAPTITLACFVERVAHRVTVDGAWVVTLQLSPADEDGYWQLDVAGRSELDTTARLSY